MEDSCKNCQVNWLCFSLPGGCIWRVVSPNPAKKMQSSFKTEATFRKLLYSFASFVSKYPMMILFLSSNFSISAKLLNSLIGSTNCSRIKVANASGDRWPLYSFLKSCPFLTAFRVGYLEIWKRVPIEAKRIWKIRISKCYQKHPCFGRSYLLSLSQSTLPRTTFPFSGNSEATLSAASSNIGASILLKRHQSA